MLHIVRHRLELVLEPAEVVHGRGRRFGLSILGTAADPALAAVEHAALGAVIERSLAHGDFRDGVVEIGDRRRDCARDRALGLMRSAATHALDRLGKCVEPAFDRGVHLRRDKSLGGADIAHQSFDAIVECGDGCGESGVAARRTFRRHALRTAAHQMIELLGNIVETLFECAGPRLLERRAAGMGLVGAFADRLFQPFADGEPGAARGVAGRGPSLSLYGVNAPRHACGHGQFRSRIVAETHANALGNGLFIITVNGRLTFLTGTSICWEALWQDRLKGRRGAAFSKQVFENIIDYGRWEFFTGGPPSVS